INGLSTDLGGGVIAGVEVSTDSGATWQNAIVSQPSVSTNWTYNWTPTSTGHADVLARAIDDSVNLESPLVGGEYRVTQFTTSFSKANGWSSVDLIREAKDVNGDGKSDLIGFGVDGVYGALGLGKGATYLGAEGFSPSLGLVANF